MFLFEVGSSLTVGLSILRKAVLAAIELDSEVKFRAIEIQDVSSERMLSAEFSTGQLSATEEAPERGLSIGLMPAQTASGALSFERETRIPHVSFTQESVRMTVFRRAGGRQARIGG